MYEQAKCNKDSWVFYLNVRRTWRFSAVSCVLLESKSWGDINVTSVFMFMVCKLCVCVCSCVYFCHNHLSVSDTCDFDRYRHQRCVCEGESHAYIWLPLFIYVVAFDISYILGWSSALCFHTTQLSIYLSFHWVGLEFGKFHAAPWMDVSVLLEQWWQSLSIVNKTYHCKLSAASPVCQH